VLTCCLTALASRSNAQNFSLDSAGGRFGVAVTHASAGFRSGEAFLDCNLPLAWELGHDFRLKTRLDFTAGWLGRSGENAATAGVGPTFVLGFKRLPLSLEAGSGSTLISRHEFGGKDLGGPYQFTTHVGLSWDVTRRWRVGYRFEHISNAGIGNHNPGLNLQALAVSWVF